MRWWENKSIRKNICLAESAFAGETLAIVVRMRLCEIMVSIIIPVYNTGKILEKCLRSVLVQAYKDWECIIVDDCSTDKKTLELLEKWSRKDARIVLFRNQENLGIERNRFVGLSMARGQFVMFMDHDDWLYNRMSLQHLVDNAMDAKADVVIGHHRQAYGFVNRACPIPVRNGIISQPELKSKYYCSYFGVNMMPVLVWARLYRKDLIDRAQMEPHGLRYADDVAWNMFVMPFAQTVSIIPETVYVHRWGGLSSTASHALEEYKLFYRVRRDAIVRFDYPEGRKWLDIEMKNILFEHIRQQMEMLRIGKEEVVSLLKEELKEPIWTEIKSNVEVHCHDSFASAFLEGDADVMVGVVASRMSRPIERGKRFVKKILRLIQ